MEFSHKPVLLGECLENLAIDPAGIYLDGTAGGAGHSQEIAKRLTTGRLIALDKDPDAVKTASARLAPYPCAQVVQEDFKNAAPALDELGIEAIDGALLDLGVSSHQLDTPERGFSYRADAPLDMRMSQSGLSAYDVVNGYSPEELTRILFAYGEEKYARQIARKIERLREQHPIETTAQLVEAVKSALPPAVRRKEKNPARQTFQAIRIEVNGEFESLAAGMEAIFDRLAPGGRFCVITFHSLEDRMVKRQFASWTVGCTCPSDFPVCVCGKKPRGRLIYKKPITATPEELAENPRSHSAKLRVIEKLPEAGGPIPTERG
ncbi:MULTISPECIES: 16S rRNA (cytosine(1402)-N(4))-methyltransferase RsmH [Eubacteriales]|uniref:Ribosomal RNA small subunit methyltransferase H n=1 Tax=Bittarella massiliensis (ex Durand et al. 2017) TaxID=1720313 RepID=A0AAQ1MFV0_9FIRM|nr:MULTISPECIES: 16S rRNA (cytosine(1402)-N(4))-methyltransferase RsmH [Eubacteriales]ERI99839.1 S-adenosyl-methyltransferase MraW [Clostridium sp. ATCC 29733]SHG56508.1 16S rRNA (cytosine1402-N4)-methyltransferase [Bittarella massiliensis (ex Durand et al. 2017)]